MAFTELDKTKILRLKSSIASYYNLQMKKLGNRHLESLFYENCVIAGGCISSLFHDEPVNDIDLYAKTKIAMDGIKAYIVGGKNHIKSSHTYDIEDDGTVKRNDPRPLVTDNAVTLTNDVQFIYLNTWDVCKNNFDFIHCQPYYDLATQKLYISEAQYHSIRTKRLVPTGKEEIKTRRLEKYKKRGWGIEEIKPMSWSEYNVPGFFAQEIAKEYPELMTIDNTSALDALGILQKITNSIK